MGIKGLTKMLADETRWSIRETELKDYANRTIAVDTSIWIHQFLNAEGIGELKNNKEEKTDHIKGLLMRTASLLKARIKPFCVFDGPPPELKKIHTLPGRILKRKAAEESTNPTSKAEESTNPTSKADAAQQQQQQQNFRYHDTTTSKKQRRVNVLPSVQHKDAQGPPFNASKDAQGPSTKNDDAQGPSTKNNDPPFYASKESKDCQRLLQLLGLPFVQAPSEAEAQCVRLCKENKAYAVASEDSDCLPFGAPFFLRNFNCTQKNHIKEFCTAKVLNELKLSSEQFTDLCILCRRDYCPSIIGMEAKVALNLIREYHSIENFLAANSMYEIPEEWPYVEARDLFKVPDVMDVPEFS